MGKWSTQLHASCHTGSLWQRWSSPGYGPWWPRTVSVRGTHKSSLGVLCENAKCELTIPPTCHLAWELLLTQRKRKREVGGERMGTFLLWTKPTCSVKGVFVTSNDTETVGFQLRKAHHFTDLLFTSSLFTTYLSSKLQWVKPIFYHRISVRQLSCAVLTQ